ncbi:SNF2-related protein [Edwardsiella tarda]|uniref:SNF2-related protein n=1 Tax=Edwardsiella tarda TaxID=636 RepID=UPI00031142FA|nr:SNF2-related protein [Edwardsiella tarda]
MGNLNSPNRVKKACALVEEATSHVNLARRIRAVTTIRQRIEYGVQKKPGVSISKARIAANTAAIALLNMLDEHSVLTDEQKRVLAGYTGEGGLKGDLGTDGTGKQFEYYTPEHVAQGMWDLLSVYGADVGNGLEPSAGTGIFNETKPASAIMTAAELNPLSAKINQLLHPEDKVASGAFERTAANTPDGTFDFSIGNVPFGEGRPTAYLDPEYKDESNIGRYFVQRMIDKTKPNGLICVIVPYGMTSGSSHKKFRAALSRKAEFLGAHRMPSTTFENAGTETATDVWVLKKHPAEAVDRIANASSNELAEANILWDTFISGRWFEKDGKRFIHGSEEVTGAGKFRRLAVKSNGITNEQVKKSLAHRFDSRINWDLLEFTPETAPHIYAEGERRVINGRWHKLTLGSWDPEALDMTKPLDASRYGATDASALQTLLKSTAGTLTLPLAQIKNIAADFPHMIDDTTRRAMEFAKQQKPAAQERVFRGHMLGQSINNLSDSIALLGNGHEHVQAIREDIRRLVAKENDRYGITKNDRLLRSLNGPGAGQWLSFVNATSSTGELSDLLSNSLDVMNGVQLDTEDINAVLHHLYGNAISGEVSLADFRELYTGKLPSDDMAALCFLANQDGIAITPGGQLTKFERATSGNIQGVTASIMEALQAAPADAIKQNLQLQLQAIERKRKKTKPEDITFSMGARWMDRSIIAEFLQSEGYDKLRYIKSEKVENGILTSEDYQGKDGIFVGYTRSSIFDKNEGCQVYKEIDRSGENFERQLEHWLNGRKPRGVNAAAYSARIREMEARFDQFIRQHDDFENVVSEYNESFNFYIPFEHSDADLQLKSASGERLPFSYQNSAIRRLSEDGRGILAFGTGLGKTTTALALMAYNYEQGRSKRTCIVVPKAVLENWYHETREFYNADAFRHMLFIGLDVVANDDGSIQRIPVLDENGQQRINKLTGTPVMRDNVTLSDAKTITARMHSVPHSNWRTVIMTKEQYAKLPLREETISDHTSQVMYDFAEAGKVSLTADGHRAAAQRANLKAKASDTGTDKNQEYPYFEDMGFDSVIVDEGHNYRNSFSLGRESAGLAYLPSANVAKSARDMALKNQYLMKKFSGRGTVMLTATPAVNSPVDAYNMLSHVMTQEEWQSIGVYTPDDFIRVFGEVESVIRQTLAGDAVSQDGLVGFKNLDGLRGIFHRWVNLKSADDVGKVVKIPNLEESNVEAPMSDEQEDIYTNLRQRAKWATMTPLERQAAQLMGMEPPLDIDGNEIEKDEIFSIIRDMDRVCSDLDLYYHRMTFRFPLNDADAVRALADDLPKTIRIEQENSAGEIETVNTTANIAITTSDKAIELVVPESFEAEVTKRLKKFQLHDVTHPMVPKYAAMLANLKKHYDAGGKQIIFSDEKSQHGKLTRLIAQYLSIDAKEIGIINATSVAERGKPASRLKKPKAPGKNAPAEDIAAYETALDAYNAEMGEGSLSGLEAIAADYNEGRTRIVICNKKAEVGINLHQGTTAIHHLTLPWTPASIAQRNGRGARVGASQEKVDVYYYCGKGSFDEFRLETLKRKAAWINELFTSDETKMRNADADSAQDVGLLLAENDTERREKMEEARQEIARKMMEAAKSSAKISLQRYLKATAAANEGIESLTENEQTCQENLNLAEKKLAQKQAMYDELLAKKAMLKATVEANPEKRKELAWDINYNNRQLKESAEVLALFEKGANTHRRRLLSATRKVNRAKSADSEIKRLAPVIKSAIEKGLINADSDLLLHPEQYILVDGEPVRIGAFYDEKFWTDDKGKIMGNRLLVVKALSFDQDENTITVEAVHRPNGVYTISAGSRFIIPAYDFSRRFTPASYTEDDAALLRDLEKPQSPTAIVLRVGAEKAARLMQEGRLTINMVSSLVFNAEGNLAVVNRITTPEELRSLYLPEEGESGLRSTAAKLAFDQYGNTVNPEQMAYIFGPDWERVAKEYLAPGNDEDIEQFAKEQAAHARRLAISSMLEQGYAGTLYLNGEASITTDQLWCIEDSFLPKNVSNPEAFKEAATLAVKGVADLIAQEGQESAKNDSQERMDDFRTLLDNTDAQIKMRRHSLHNLDSIPPSYRETIRILDTHSNGASIRDNIIHYPQVLADLVTLGYLSKDEITLSDMASYQALKNIAAAALDRMCVDEEKEQEKKADTVSASALLEQPEPKERATSDDVLSLAASLNLQCKLNSKPVRTRRFTFEPGEAWGLHDPNGLNGILYNNKEGDDGIKARYGAVWYKPKRAYAEALEFEGGWWLIPAKHDISDVLTHLSTK